MGGIVCSWGDKARAGLGDGKWNCKKEVSQDLNLDKVG